MTKAGQEPDVHRDAAVHASAVLHDGVRVAAGARIGSGCVLGAPGGTATNIGPDVELGAGTVVAPGVQIGSGSSVGPGSVLGAPGGAPTDVGQYVVLGANAVVAPGVRIGVGAQVHPVSYVDRDVPPHAVVAGSPARIVGYSTTTPTAPAPYRASAAQGRVELSVAGAALVAFKRAVDLRGALVAGEHPRELPFPVARFFLVLDVPGEHLRGEHAHRECHQLLLAAHGSVTVLVDDGHAREQVVLDSPDVGLHIAPGTWGVQYGYSADAVLLVLASHPYDADDYIRDYDEFRALTSSEGPGAATR